MPDTDASANGAAHNAAVATEPAEDDTAEKARIEIDDWIMEADTKKELLAKIDAKQAVADSVKDDNAAARRHWNKARKLAEDL